LSTHFSNAQSDTLPYRSFSEKIVLFSDIGYSSAPFSILYPFSQEINKIKYRNNFRPVLGLGAAYKWFSARLAVSLPLQVKPTELYGRTEQVNLNVDFSIKKWFIDLDLRNYRGYAVMNAFLWSDSLNADKPNDIKRRMNATSLSVNAWYFNSAHFKMNNVRGIKGHYVQPVHTWYIKNTLNIFGVDNALDPIIPEVLGDSLSSRTFANVYSAVDLGVIPGYAYVNRIKNWQFSGSLGFGPVVQGKFYGVNGNVRGFLGLAPRYDLRLVGGYNRENYFVMLITDFDNKSIRFNDLKYRQSYYNIRISAGVRLNRKKSKDKVER
jgi:hypothetical protein